MFTLVLFTSLNREVAEFKSTTIIPSKISSTGKKFYKTSAGVLTIKHAGKAIEKKTIFARIY